MQRHRAAPGGEAAGKKTKRAHLIQALVDEETAAWVRRQADELSMTVSAYIRMWLVTAMTKERSARRGPRAKTKVRR